MKNSKWYLSTVHRADAGGPLYNAVKIVDGKAIEAQRTPTHSRALAERYVNNLNKAKVVK